MILVQCIVTEWTKASRGAPRAAKRNAVPEALPFATTGFDDKFFTVVQQLVKYIEYNNFEESIEYSTPEIEIVNHVKSVLYSVVEDELSISIHKVDPPNLTGKSRKLFSLSNDQWGKVIYNGRSTHCDGEWKYEKVVVNIGSFMHPPPEDVFISSAPTYTHDHRGHLF